MVAQDVTHADYCGFAEAAGVSRNTLRLDVTAAASFHDATGVQLHEATPADVDAWWVALGRRGLTPATRTYYLRAVRRFYRYRQRRTGETDPTGHVDALKIPVRVPRPVPLPVAVRAIGAGPADTGVMVGAALYAGLRVHEIAKLQPADIREDGHGLYLYVIGKGSRERRVPLVPELDQLLAGYSWPDLSPNGVTMRVRHALRKADPGSRWTAHQLRHTFATRMLEAGADVFTLQRLLGHASVQTTQVYADVSLERLTDSVLRAFPGAA
jgi:site-specific recombinase XerD